MVQRSPFTVRIYTLFFSGLLLLLCGVIDHSYAQVTCNGKTATIVGTTGGTLTGTSGDDVIVGQGAFNYTINAGNGNDTICSGSGADTINAGSGDDWIDAGSGQNIRLYSK